MGMSPKAACHWLACSRRRHPLPFAANRSAGFSPSISWGINEDDPRRGLGLAPVGCLHSLSRISVATPISRGKRTATSIIDAAEGALPCMRDLWVTGPCRQPKMGRVPGEPGCRRGLHLPRGPTSIACCGSWHDAPSARNAPKWRRRCSLAGPARGPPFGRVWVTQPVGRWRSSRCSARPRSGAACSRPSSLLDVRPMPRPRAVVAELVDALA
jgi:hypothetical protein